MEKFIQTEQALWLNTPKGTIWVKTGIEEYIQPEDPKLKNTAFGVDLDLLYGGDRELFKPI